MVGVAWRERTQRWAYRAAKSNRRECCERERRWRVHACGWWHLRCPSSPKKRIRTIGARVNRGRLETGANCPPVERGPGIISDHSRWKRCPQTSWSVSGSAGTRILQPALSRPCLGRTAQQRADLSHGHYMRHAKSDRRGNTASGTSDSVGTMSRDRAGISAHCLPQYRHSTAFTNSPTGFSETTCGWVAK